MIAPVGFRSNAETLDDNAFQRSQGPTDPDVASRARAEFDALRRALEERGVEVVVFEPGDDRDTPDATFPNNWFSTHAGGRLVLYPMRATSRRRERRPEILAWLEARYPDVHDLTAGESEGRFLEGTGSLVLDERAGTAFAALSPRTSEGAVREWAARMGYRPVVFDAADENGRPIYHTNVLLTVADRFAVVCLAAIDAAQRSAVRNALAGGGREVIEISLEQMGAFCANALEVTNGNGDRFLVMSDHAATALRAEQRERIEAHATIVAVDLATIEAFGGGGARCMLAELY